MVRKLIVLIVAVGLAFSAVAGEGKPISQRKEDFLKWKFGMFIHFNLATFNEREWANGYEDPATFAPDKLDCNQWAEAAAAAGMKYAVLTVKHTGGWCLWDSNYTASHDMTAFAKYKDGKGDLVREFVDAFRARGIGIGLYYCAPGDYNGKNGNPGLAEGEEDLHGMPPEAKGDYAGFMMKQLTELLTQYGPIDLLWVDQYRRPYTRDRWQEIIQHVKSLQPDCLVIANNSQDFANTDIFSYEYPWMMKTDRPERALPPEGNEDPGEVCDYMGPAWFWKSTEEWTLKSAEEIVSMLKRCNSRRANYLLNVAPDTSGRIPAPSVKRLREVGDLLGAAQPCEEEQPDKTAWFEGKWGVMFHYLATPALRGGDGMSADEWRRQIDEFDVDGLAAQLQEVGADYFMITLGQGAGYYLAPNTVYDNLIGPGSSKSPDRDLVADLADALSPLGIKLLVYTASDLGWGDLETRKALGMTSWHGDHKLGLRDGDIPNDWEENRKGQIEFLKNWVTLHEYWSKQWGKKVAGWWVDGCYQKDIRFPENEPPNLKTLKDALLTGNPEAIITFNGGKGVYVYSQHEDYTAGEISRSLPDCPGPWIEKDDDHRSRYHVLTYLGEKWGRGTPRFTDEKAGQCAAGITSKGGFVTFDVPPQKNGLIPVAFLPQLKHIGTSVGNRVHSFEKS